MIKGNERTRDNPIHFCTHTKKVFEEEWRKRVKVRQEKYVGWVNNRIKEISEIIDDGLIHLNNFQTKTHRMEGWKRNRRINDPHSQTQFITIHWCNHLVVNCNVNNRFWYGHFPANKFLTHSIFTLSNDSFNNWFSISKQWEKKKHFYFKEKFDSLLFSEKLCKYGLHMLFCCFVWKVVISIHWKNEQTPIFIIRKFFVRETKTKCVMRWIKCHCACLPARHNK